MKTLAKTLFAAALTAVVLTSSAMATFAAEPGDYPKSGHLFFVKVATFFGLNCSLFSFQNGHSADFKRF